MAAAGGCARGVVYPFPRFPGRPYVCVRYDAAWDSFRIEIVTVGDHSLNLMSWENAHDDALAAAGGKASALKLPLLDLTAFQLAENLT